MVYVYVPCIQVYIIIKKFSYDQNENSYSIKIDSTPFHGITFPLDLD